MGDIITKVGDKKVDGPSSLSDAVRSFKPKDEVTISYKRDGKENTAKALLGERKETPMAFSYSGPNGNMRSFKSIPKMDGKDFGIMNLDARPFIQGEGSSLYSYTRHQTE